ncbi:MAG: penicillin-binding protein 1C [Gammaproteobacteria bacterium]
MLVLDQAFPPPLERASNPGNITVLARDGSPLRAFPDAEGIWRVHTDVNKVSPRYIEALLTYEDRYFHQHPGVNPGALLRAAWQWLNQGEIVSGGSTLSMQVARLLEPHDRTIPGKLRQIARALQLEWRLSKNEILDIYLNLAPFGGTLEGVEAASRAYLGHSAHELTHAEAALLAVLPQAPSRLRPDRHPQRAQRARDKVLDRMLSLGTWDKETVEEAKREIVAALSPDRPMLAPLLARRLIGSAESAESVHSTIDAHLQINLEGMLANHANRLPAHSSAAILVVDNQDLGVRAYLGSADFLNDARFGHVDMVRARRSPGSTLKPFLYGMALDEGLIHSESLLVDAPLSFNDYRPGNFGGGYRGPVSATQALQQSLNIPAVALIERLGPERFHGRLRHVGLKLALPANARPNAAMILGGAATGLNQLVSTYTALARGGKAGALRYTQGQPREERYLMSPGAAWIVRRMLEDREPRHIYRHSRTPVAWKTGTSYGFRDAWAMGVTGRYSLGVWIGRPDGTPVPGSYGAVSALPLLFQVVDLLPNEPPTAGPPASVSEEEICWPLGLAASTTQEKHCHQLRSAWVLDKTVPPTLPSIGTRTEGARLASIQLDKASGQRVLPHCQPGDVETTEVALWPTAVEPYIAPSLRAANRVPPLSEACSGLMVASLGLELMDVGEQITVTAVPGADSTGCTAAGVKTVNEKGCGSTAISLRARGGQAPLRWMINGVSTSELGPGFQARLDPGEYRVTVTDQSGAFDSVAVRVLPGVSTETGRL